MCSAFSRSDSCKTYGEPVLAATKRARTNKDGTEANATTSGWQGKMAAIETEKIRGWMRGGRAEAG